METIAFPPVIADLVAGLPALLASHEETAPIHTRIPNPRPSRFLRLLRTGGSRANLVTGQAQVTYECWDDSSAAAEMFARTTQAVLLALRGETVGGAFVHRVQEVGGPQDLPDPHSEQARFTGSVLIDVRGQAI